MSMCVHARKESPARIINVIYIITTFVEVIISTTEYLKSDGFHARCGTVTFKITVTVKEEGITSEQIQQAANYISGALDSMQISQVIELHKDKMKLSKQTRPLQIEE
jgi:hypothetical protein